MDLTPIGRHPTRVAHRRQTPTYFVAALLEAAHVDPGRPETEPATARATTSAILDLTTDLGGVGDADAFAKSVQLLRRVALTQDGAAELLRWLDHLDALHAAMADHIARAGERRALALVEPAPAPDGRDGAVPDEPTHPPPELAPIASLTAAAAAPPVGPVHRVRPRRASAA